MLLNLIALMIVGLSWVARAKDALPIAHDKSRYESLRVKSPFALATVAAATPAPQASFAANWYVTGVARIGDKDFVTVKSRDLATQFTLFGDEPVDGVSLASVNWSDTVGKSTVVLRKGTETARLEFNEAQLHAPAPATASAGQASAGTKPKPMTGVPSSNPPPIGRPVTANNKLAPPSNGATGGPRRRVLPIPVPR